MIYSPDVFGIAHAKFRHTLKRRDVRELRDSVTTQSRHATPPIFDSCCPRMSPCPFPARLAISRLPSQKAEATIVLVALIGWCVRAEPPLAQAHTRITWLSSPCDRLLIRLMWTIGRRDDGFSRVDCTGFWSDGLHVRFEIGQRICREEKSNHTTRLVHEKREGLVVGKHALIRNGGSSWPRVLVDAGISSLHQNPLATYQSVAFFTKTHARSCTRGISGELIRPPQCSGNAGPHSYESTSATFSC